MKQDYDKMEKARKKERSTLVWTGEPGVPRESGEGGLRVTGGGSMTNGEFRI